jgi:hypothetical protein
VRIGHGENDKEASAWLMKQYGVNLYT